jgi:glutamate-1-semialdehyde 2,1-aminomutase
MWFTPMDKWSQVGDPEVKPYSEGVPISTKSFRALRAGQRCEPARGCIEAIWPSHCLSVDRAHHGKLPGYCGRARVSAAARQLCDKHGVVLLIDEVKTGFRVARGGVQELYGVKADLCTFAKAVANGYPISVLAGREEIMRKIGRGCCAWRHLHRALGVTGSRQDLCRFSMRPMRWSALPSTEQSCVTACGQYFSARGIAHSFVGHPSMSGLYFAHEPPRNVSRLEEQRLLVLRRHGAGAA